MNTSEVLDKITIRNKTLTAQEYFLKVNDTIKSRKTKEVLSYVNYSALCRVVVNSNKIKFLNGHEFLFNMVSATPDSIYTLLEDVYNVLVIEENKVKRIFLIRYPMSHAGQLTEIRIEGFIRPSLNKLDFLRLAYKEDDSDADEYIKQLKNKYYKVYNLVKTDIKTDLTQVKDISSGTKLEFNFILNEYGLETAKNFYLWSKAKVNSMVLNNQINKVNIIKNLEFAIKKCYKLRKYYRIIKLEESKCN